MIPYGRQDISSEDIDAVVTVLKSDFITQGPVVPEFEDAVAAYCTAEYGVAVNSGTSALHIACLALGVGAGDVVWTSPITFVASANCAAYCGARVEFVDIDPHTYNMSVEKLEEKLVHSAAEGTLPKVVIPVHMCGQSCDMAQIKRLSETYGFYIIEDACHALGGRYQDHLVGSCRYSDITVFSLHPVKIITSGEGGVAVTNEVSLYQKMRMFRSHGITRDPEEMEGPYQGDWYYQQLLLGFNYRMTELQAALGLSQMKKIDSYVSRRNEIADFYGGALESLPVKLPSVSEGVYSSFHLYVVRLDLGQAKKGYRDVFDGMRRKGIGVNLHYIPVYHQPYYRKCGYRPEDYPNADLYAKEAMTIPLFPTIEKEALLQVVRGLREVLTDAD